MTKTRMDRELEARIDQMERSMSRIEKVIASLKHPPNHPWKALTRRLALCTKRWFWMTHPWLLKELSCPILMALILLHGQLELSSTSPSTIHRWHKGPVGVSMHGRAGFALGSEDPYPFMKSIYSWAYPSLWERYVHKCLWKIGYLAIAIFCGSIY